MQSPTLETRFRSRLQPDGECLVWTGAKTRGGYGKLYSHSIGRKTVLIDTHRLAYDMAHGPIPEGAHVLHRCDNPACCNPAHLFLGTQAENMQDKANKGRAVPGPASKKEFWTDDRKIQRSAAFTAARAKDRAASAIAAGYQADWKRCPACSSWKSPDLFGNNKARPDGKQAQCKPCKGTADIQRARIKTGRKTRTKTRSDKIHF